MNESYAVKHEKSLGNLQENVTVKNYHHPCLYGVKSHLLNEQVMDAINSPQLQLNIGFPMNGVYLKSTSLTAPSHKFDAVF